MSQANRQAAAETDDNHIGTTLRLRRRVRRESLQNIAEMAGISATQLSLVERGLAQPSLRTLRLICEALQMPMSWLFVGESGASALEGGIVVRRKQRRHVDLGPEATAKELLTGDVCSEIQLMQVTIPPEGGSGQQPFKTGLAARCGVVTQGRLGLEVDGQTFVLDKDDSFAFAKRETCRFWCESSETCIVIWAVAPAIY